MVGLKDWSGRLVVVGAVAGLLALSSGCGGTEDNDDRPSGTSGGGSGGEGVSGAHSAGGGAAPVAGTAGSGGDAGAGGMDVTEGGTGGESGSSGEGGSGPEPRVFEPIASIPADKIDLLFMIDNSISMEDKQELLRSALPLLVQRLITPACVDASGAPVGTHAREDGTCSQGEPEFRPIRDIHIGVVTSSLGAHGGDICTALSPPGSAHEDDKAHLIPSVRPGLSSWNDMGFLAWDPDGDRNDPPGTADAAELVDGFSDMVAAVDNLGCGYEASLEAWYRFLVDPDPPSGVRRGASFNEITYPDETTLAQRAAFLRADSLVGIVILSDENDCSIVDEGQGFLVSLQSINSATFRMPRATSVCATDPNDPCCLSCAVASPSGCNVAADPECALGELSAEEDHMNLRCFDHKRRFGFDLLYPIERYLNGLTRVQIPNRDGELVPNPLFAPDSEGRSRDLSRVFVTGIVGVPWQDVADAASLEDPRHLRYLSAQELTDQDRWSLVLGEADEPPRDGLMYETTVDRSTLGFEPHPLTGAELAPSSSTSPSANPINGHELVNSNIELQYACIFPLTTPRGPCEDTQNDCDCRPVDAQYGRPLCRPPAGGPVSTTQYFAKAYPGARQLELLRAFGDITGNSVVASICPKVLDSEAPSTDPFYGYNPAITALVERMKGSLSPACLAEELQMDADGQVACRVLEIGFTDGTCDACDGAGRTPADPAAREGFLRRLKETRFCGASGQPACDSLCVCEVAQMEETTLSACQNGDALPVDAAGFCYVDAERNPGSDALVEHCPVGRKRRLRFAGPDIPRSGARTFLFCE